MTGDDIQCTEMLTYVKKKIENSMEIDGTLGIHLAAEEARMNIEIW